MKKYNFIFFAAVIFNIFTACSKNEVEDTQLVCGEITAVTGSTKTMLSGKNVHWNAGDAVSVFTDAGTVHSFVTEEGGPTATFTGMISHYATKVDVLYPMNPKASFDNGRFVTTLSSRQIAVQDGFESGLAIMTAKGDLDGYKCQLGFKQACALVKFTATDQVESVELVAPQGTLVAGKASIDPGLGAPTAVDGESCAILVPADGQNTIGHGGTFNFTVYPFSASECKLVYHIGKQTKTRTLDISASRASVFVIEGSDADLEFDPYVKTVKVGDTVLSLVETDLYEGTVDMQAVSSFNVMVDDVPYGFLSFSGAGGLGSCASDFSALPWYNRSNAQTTRSVDYYTSRATGSMVENGGNKFYTNFPSATKVYFRIDLRNATPIYYMEVARTPDPSVVFHEDFDLCVFGGDYIIAIPGTSSNATKSGYEAGKKGGNTANQPGTVFDYPIAPVASEAQPIASESYIASRGLSGWEFKYAGERPGALQLCSGGIGGFMITPALSSLDAVSAVTLTIDISRFSATSKDPIKVILLDGGTFTSGSASVQAYAASGKPASTTKYESINSNTFAIEDNDFCPHTLDNNDKDKPHTILTLHASGVTPSTRIKIDAAKGASNAPRCFVFDIKVTK